MHRGSHRFGRERPQTLSSLRDEVSGAPECSVLDRRLLGPWHGWMDYLGAIIDATEAMLTSLGPLGKRLLQGLGVHWSEGRRGEVPVLRSYRREKLVEALRSLFLDQVDEVDLGLFGCAPEAALGDLPRSGRSAFDPTSPNQTIQIVPTSGRSTPWPSINMEAKYVGGEINVH